MNFFKTSKLIFISIFVLIFSVFINTGYAVIDWEEPTEDPPAGNVAPPLNQGVTSQHKEGSLVVGSSSSDAGGNLLKVVGASSFQDTSFQGNISIAGDSNFSAKKTIFLFQDSSRIQLLNNSFMELSNGTYIDLSSGSYIQGAYSGHDRPIIDLSSTGSFGREGLLSSESRDEGVSIFAATGKDGIAIWGIARDERGLSGRFDGETNFNNLGRDKTTTINGYVLAPNGLSTVVPSDSSGLGNGLTPDKAYQDNTIVTERVCFLNHGELDCANSITDPDSENDFIWNANSHPSLQGGAYQDASIRVTGDIKTRGIIYVYGSDGATHTNAEIKIQSAPEDEKHWGIYNDYNDTTNNLVFWRDSNKLTLQEDGGVKIHQLGGDSNRCLYVDSGGVIQAATDDCGLANNDLIEIPCNGSVQENPSKALKVGEKSYVYDSSCGTGGAETLHIQSGETINIGSKPQLSDTAKVLQVTNDSNILFTVLGSGNVGIGTISPSAKLQVNGAIQLDPMTAPSPTANRLYNTGGNLFWNGMKLNNEPQTNYWESSANDPSTINTISSVARVGIFTTEPIPTSGLHVNGDTFIAGELTAAGTIKSIVEICVDGSCTDNFKAQCPPRLIPVYGNADLFNYTLGARGDCDNYPGYVIFLRPVLCKSDKLVPSNPDCYQLSPELTYGNTYDYCNDFCNFMGFAEGEKISVEDSIYPLDDEKCAKFSWSPGTWGAWSIYDCPGITKIKECKCYVNLN